MGVAGRRTRTGRADATAIRDAESWSGRAPIPAAVQLRNVGLGSESNSTVSDKAGVQSTYWSGVTTTSGSFTPVAWFGQ